MTKRSQYRRPLILTGVGGLGFVAALAALVAVWSSAGVHFSFNNFTLGVDFGAVDAVTTVALILAMAITMTMMVVGVVRVCVLLMAGTYRRGRSEYDRRRGPSV